MNKLMERQLCSYDYEIILETKIVQIGGIFTELRALEDQKYAIAETRGPPQKTGIAKKLEDGG